MDYWQSSIVANVLSIGVFLAIAAILRARIPAWGRLAVPDGITAGALALSCGPDLLAIAPLDRAALEPGVYHGFAIVFIAVGLQAAPRRDAAERARGSARSLSFAFIAMAVVQSLVTFGVLAIWGSTQNHPGLGFMVTLGFAQGPGQALSFGSAWERVGMTDGAQIGLAFAALGFAWCCALGVPLVAIARRKGWLDPLPPVATAAVDDANVHDLASPPESVEVRTSTKMEPLTLQLVIIACIYALVFGVLLLITRVLPQGSFIATLWGFHFLFGSAFAIVLRRISDRARTPLPLDDGLLGRVAVVAVDFTTAAALGAIELQTLGRYLVPILVLSTIGGLLTLWLALWLARRAFPEAPFSHALLLYGTCTGTIPTGLALLRMVDPELRGPVARSTVIAATASVPLGIPLFMGVIPLAVSRWPSGWWPSIVIPLAALAIYVVVLAVLWRRLAWLKWLRPLRSVWPRDP